MKSELNIFLTAVVFYTRIPCAKWVLYSEEYVGKCIRYLPLLGWVIGGISALVFYLFSICLPISVSLLLAVIAGVLVTGAFHEDGFADVCDGFGGGWTRDKIMEIMVDSRIGVFGAVGLIFILSLKYLLLLEIEVGSIPLVLIAGHAVSRFSAVTVIFNNEYVRKSGPAKAGYAAGNITFPSLCISAVFGLSSLALLGNPWYCLSLVPVFLVRWYMARFFRKWIGGYTGDCLGAIQQVSEVVFYMAFLVIWKYI